MNKIKNLLKHFEKIWDKKSDADELSNIIIEKLSKDKEIKGINWEDYIGYIDNPNVLLVVPKKEWLKKLIENNFKVKEEKERARNLINSLSYAPDNWEEISCSYSEEYLNIIFGLIKGYEKIKFKMKKDSPLWVETNDFIIILAPRIEEEEN